MSKSIKSLFTGLVTLIAFATIGGAAVENVTATPVNAATTAKKAKKSTKKAKKTNKKANKSTKKAKKTNKKAKKTNKKAKTTTKAKKIAKAKKSLKKAKANLKKANKKSAKAEKSYQKALKAYNKLIGKKATKKVAKKSANVTDSISIKVTVDGKVTTQNYKLTGAKGSVVTILLPEGATAATAATSSNDSAVKISPEMKTATITLGESNAKVTINVTVPASKPAEPATGEPTK